MIRKLVATVAIAGSLALAVACGSPPIIMPDDIKHPEGVDEANGVFGMQLECKKDSREKCSTSGNWGRILTKGVADDVSDSSVTSIDQYGRKVVWHWGGRVVFSVGGRMVERNNKDIPEKDEEFMATCKEVDVTMETVDFWECRREW